MAEGTTAPAAKAPARPKRRRRPPRAVTVEKIERVTPRVINVRFGGDGLAGFDMPKPGAHMKLFFPPEGMEWPPSDPESQERPPSRTYTPRRYDPDTNTLDVEFVLHGDGLAAGWVQAAQVGDDFTLAGPGGGYDVPDDAKTLIIIADDTAMPAAGMIVEAAPEGCAVTAFCEIEDAAEQRPLSPEVAVKPTWLHRAGSGVPAGVQLEKAVAGLDAPANAYWWIACEANAMRRIRKHLMTERGVALDHIHTRGYWRLGETNYPDHDYGND